jgi:alkyl hydroperoxide reductase subunit F
MDLNFNFNLSDAQGEHKAIPLDAEIVYDVLIVGGGPAAMTAAVYCMRKGVKTGLITKSVGGQVAETASVENYIGFKYIEGLNLVNKFRDHFKQFEIGYKEGIRAISITPRKIKTVTLEDGSSYQAKALIICTGKSSKKLNVPGEKKLTGKGVAYCAICDAPLFAGRKVAVIGGGNSGIEAAIDLVKLAEHVTIIEFLDILKADDILIDKLKSFENYKILSGYEVISINGDSQVESITIKNRKSAKTEKIDLNGVFIEIGLVPNTGFIKDTLKLNQLGEIIVDCDCCTNIPGIFAAGDVTSVPYKQIIIAAGEGAKAALSASDYVLKNEWS